jgi:hypothetical protein
MKTDVYTLNRKLGRRQQRRDHEEQRRRRWTTRNELRQRLPRIHDYGLRRQTLRAIHSRSHRRVNLALDLLIADQEAIRKDSAELPTDPDFIAYPPLVCEPLNPDPADLERVWRP